MVGPADTAAFAEWVLREKLATTTFVGAADARDGRTVVDQQIKTVGALLGGGAPEPVAPADHSGSPALRSMAMNRS